MKKTRVSELMLEGFLWIVSILSGFMCLAIPASMADTVLRMTVLGSVSLWKDILILIFELLHLLALVFIFFFFTLPFLAGKKIEGIRYKRLNAFGSVVKLNGTDMYMDSAVLRRRLRKHSPSSPYGLYGFLPLMEKDPVISVFVDGVKVCEYRLQTEGDEDFTGKYFHVFIRLALTRWLCIPKMEMEGFISDTPEERGMTPEDIHYRMETRYLNPNDITGKQRSKRYTLTMEGLGTLWRTVSEDVRLVGICPNCGKSFCFRSYSFYNENCMVAYSDDGLDCCKISEQNIDENNWQCEADGKTFRYFNAFCCVHCGAPYINYKKSPNDKIPAEPGYVHLGRKVYTDRP